VGFSKGDKGGLKAGLKGLLAAKLAKKLAKKNKGGGGYHKRSIADDESVDAEFARKRRAAAELNKSEVNLF
jgi:hypothetical protein